MAAQQEQRKILFDWKLALYRAFLELEEPSESDINIAFEISKDPDVRAFLTKAALREAQ